MSRAPNWYLDPVVARQKRAVHLEWIRRNVPALSVSVLLKTDLFEEAYGDDELLFSLPFEAELKIGIDINTPTVQLAATRRNSDSSQFVVADVRRLPFPDRSIDVVLSNSTLDHFSAARDLEVSIQELARILKPGGLLLITLDNPQNPLFLLFRAGARWCMPYRLGHTATRGQLAHMLEAAGLQLLTTDWLIHNPRFVSTLLFLALRCTCGPRGDRIIGAMLRAFAALDRLPTRSYTAAFVAACGRKQV